MRFNIIGFITATFIVITMIMNITLMWINFGNDELFIAYFISSIGWILASLLHTFYVKTHI